MNQFDDSKLKVLIVLLILLQLIGCKPTRWVEQGDYLLKKNTIVIDNKSIDKKELESYYRQEPNRRFLMLFKFHLSIYNLSKLGKERKMKNWVGRVIGEEPVIYDSMLVERTAEQFKKFMQNEAYYNAKVTHHVEHNRQRAWVTYNIKTFKPILINRVMYEINDTALWNLVYADTADSPLMPGERMTVNLLEEERNRIVTQLRDSGYFEFSPEHIHYNIDTFSTKANITLVLEKALSRDTLMNVSQFPHKKYWINKVYFLPDFDPKRTIRERDSYFNSFDTTYYEGYAFIYPGDVNVKPKTILKANTIKQGEIYNFSKVNNTTRYLNSLKLFRLNNLNFYKEATSDSLINCIVQLTPSVYQNYSLNFETTYTDGIFGLGGFVNYQHKNLFKGAEIFNVKVSGIMQRQSNLAKDLAFNIFEYGAETSLETPSFILPFKMQRFYKKYNPKTNFLVSYSFQDRPDYERTFTNSAMGYNWRGSKTIRHFLNPIEIGMVDVTVTDEFMDSIRGKYLENNFKDYLITGGSYSLIYQNKSKNTYRSFSYYRLNIGFAGNLLHFANSKLGMKKPDDDSSFSMFGLPYAQYVLANFDYRYNYFISKENSLIARSFAGFALPYGNSEAIPFIKQYFSGGAQGIRAWSPRDLGPGTYIVDDSVKIQSDFYPNQLGDIKLEFNLEYRYSLNNSWKGAIFIDAGNIWLHKQDESRPGADFKFDQFYKQIALGTGFGIRYDLEFAVFRIDWGIKVRDPGFQGKESWVLFNTPFIPKSDIIWHIAVGYPF